MPQRHIRDLRRIRMDVGGDRSYARPRPHVRHRQPADGTGRNRQNGQIHQRGQDIHPIPRTQRTKVLGKRPMVAIDLLRKRRTHKRGHREKIHPDPKGKSLDQTAIPPRPQEAGHPHPKNGETGISVIFSKSLRVNLPVVSPPPMIGYSKPANSENSICTSPFTRRFCTELYRTVPVRRGLTGPNFIP